MCVRVLTVNEKQLPHPSSGGSSSISTGAIVAIAIAVPTVVLFTVTVVIVFIIYHQVSKKKSSKIFKEFYRKSGNFITSSGISVACNYGYCT